MNKPSIAFVGIGAMGTPMAGRLAAASYSVAVFDKDTAKAQALAQTHKVRLAASLADAATGADIVITMLPDGAIVRSAVCGANDSFTDCLAAAMKPGALLIDMSSSQPMGTRALGKLLAARGLRMMDAPVSNGVKGAIAGTLCVMAGGAKEDFDAQRALLEVFGKTIYHAGPLGAGHAIKALNNYVSAAGLVAACEAVITARRFGIDPQTATDIINASSGMNNTTKNKVAQYMLSGKFDAGFSTGLMAKDVRTALELALAMGAPVELAAHTANIWNEAEKDMGAAADHTAMFRFLDAR